MPAIPNAPKAKHAKMANAKTSYATQKKRFAAMNASTLKRISNTAEHADIPVKPATPAKMASVCPKAHACPTPFPLKKMMTAMALQTS